MIPKPEPRARIKRRRKDAERRVITKVRAQVKARDGYCRLFGLRMQQFGGCGGPSEWAHLEEGRRFKTRGKPPEERHTTVDSLMLCNTHHTAYDRHRITIEKLTPRGGDGPLKFATNGAVYIEVEDV